MAGDARWFEGRKTREDCAQRYAVMLRKFGLAAPAWASINAELLARYKPSGLDWIKKRAWKIAQGGRDGR